MKKNISEDIKLMRKLSNFRIQEIKSILNSIDNDEDLDDIKIDYYNIKLSRELNKVDDLIEKISKFKSKLREARMKYKINDNNANIITKLIMRMQCSSINSYDKTIKVCDNIITDLKAEQQYAYNKTSVIL